MKDVTVYSPERHPQFKKPEDHYPNVTMLGSELSRDYWNGYTLRFPGEQSWLTRLPNRKDWMDEEGNFKEGAFIEVSLLRWGEFDDSHDNMDLWKIRTAAEIASEEAQEYGLEAGQPDLLHRRLMQPGDPKGAMPEVDMDVPAKAVRLSQTPAKAPGLPGSFFVDPIFGRGRSLSFGRVVVIQAPAPAPGGGESMGIGPFTYTGKNSWVLMSLLIMLLLFFLFR